MLELNRYIGWLLNAGGSDAFVQRANLSQYFVALPINAGVLDRGQAVRSGGIKNSECDHPLAELAFQVDKRFGAAMHGAGS